MYFILERDELVRYEFVQWNFQNDEQEHQLTSDSKAAAPAKSVNNREVLNLIAYIMRTSIYHEIMRSLYFLFSGICASHNIRTHESFWRCLVAPPCQLYG